MTPAELDEIGTRVTDFGCMKLPGQPFGMHMGTSYLVNDLWRAVRELRADLAAKEADAAALRALLTRWQTVYEYQWEEDELFVDTARALGEGR